MSSNPLIIPAFTRFKMLSIAQSGICERSAKVIFALASGTWESKCRALFSICAAITRWRGSFASRYRRLLRGTPEMMPLSYAAFA